MIKAVAQTLPTYTMSYFKLPVTLCHELETMICRFFWGQRGESRKIHWAKWLDLCKPKSHGGMGFKDLSNFNDALLAKQTWRLLHDTNSLFYRVFKARFFPNSSVMEATTPTNASYAWRSLVHGREVIRRGGAWRIGLGKSIHIWGDNWLPTSHRAKIIFPMGPGGDTAMVSELIDLVNRTWRAEVIDRMFFESEAAVIRVYLYVGPYKIMS